MRRTIATGIVALMTCAWFASPAGAENRNLFVIERSKNANIVKYDARIGKDGAIDKKQPVEAYWVLKAEDGRRQELSILDKRAYGFSVTWDTDQRCYRMTITPFRAREIRITESKGAPEADTVINGKPACLQKIFIKSVECFPKPKVQYMVLFGKDKKTGKDMYEKIVP